MPPRAPALLPIAAVTVSTAAFQLGAALAKDLFATLGPQGAATLRLGFGAILLLLFVRPWRTWPKAAPRSPLVGIGLAMAFVILAFYMAIDRLPLGVAIALQFLGPLVIALAGSRRWPHFAWAVIAAAGVWLLVGQNVGMGPLDPVGIAWALASAVGWAVYIIAGRAAGRVYGGSTAALALTIAALVILPFGIHEAGWSLLSPTLLPLAVLIAVLSSALPFSLEFYALPRLSPRTFSVFTSLEPAFGVVAGFFILGEALGIAQIAGVGLVIVAAAGAAWSNVRDTGPAILE